MDAPPEERASRIRLEQPLASMRVYRREVGTFLILFVFGFLLLAGGWVLAYLGGMWRFSAGGAPLAVFSGFPQCAGLVATLHTLHPTAGSLAASASCSLHSADSSGLAFVGLGAASMAVGLAAFKKRFSSVGERISALWWALALAVPLFGGIIAYVGIRERNRTSAIGMVLLGVETLFGSALLYILTGFPLTTF